MNTTRTEPAPMEIVKVVAGRFFAFLIRNLYFVFAIFAVSFLYKFLIFKYVPNSMVKPFVNMIFDLSFYPVLMIFSMYLVNAFYAGKQVRNFEPILEDGRSYFQPLLAYYAIIMMTLNVINMINPAFMAISLVLLIKLLFVDQLIYYKNLGVIEAIKSSWSMVSMRLFFIYFIFALFTFSMMSSLMGLVIRSYPENAFIIGRAVEIFFYILIRFFVTITYRELIQVDFYRTRS